MNVCQVSDQPENLEKPDDNNDHNHNVDDPSDFVIHWDVRIHKPEDNTHNN